MFVLMVRNFLSTTCNFQPSSVSNYKDRLIIDFVKSSGRDDFLIEYPESTIIYYQVKENDSLLFIDPEAKVGDKIVIGYITEVQKV